MIRYLLDTKIVIYVIKKRPLEVLQAFNKNSRRMAISSITLAELFHGVEKSARCAENLAVIDDFTSHLELLPYTPKAAQHYGSIRAALERRGETIGINDLHIAAHARSEGLVLATNNLESLSAFLRWKQRTGSASHVDRTADRYLQKKTAEETSAASFAVFRPCSELFGAKAG